MVATFPTPTRYRDAITAPGICFRDPVLADGSPILDPLGMPKAISGNFASVFQLSTPQGRFAVKCFTRNVNDQQTRYRFISEELRRLRPKWAMIFEYLDDGMLVAGSRYPVLKMRWVDGESLLPYVAKHVHDRSVMTKLADDFADVVLDLQRNGIGHGDLQHGNILVTSDGIKLIDYDGMYVPALRGRHASEIGHSNYQPPLRNVASFGPYIDHFAAWVIYGSLVALTSEPRLWHELHRDGDEALLLKADDFKHPNASAAMRRLRLSDTPEVRSVADILTLACESQLDAVPAFDPRRGVAPLVRPMFSEGTARARVPEWLTDRWANVAALSGESMGRGGGRPQVDWVASHPAHLPQWTWGVDTISPAVTFGVIAVLLALSILLPVAGVPISALVLAVTLASMRQAATHRPEWAHARSARETLRAATETAERCHKAMDEAERERRTLDKGPIERLRGELRSLAERHSRQADVLTRELHAQEAKVAEHRDELKRSLPSRFREALTALQRRSVDEALRAARLRQASLHGIGPDLVAAMGAHGIESAADFTGCTVQGEVAYLNLTNGRLVRVANIGPVKARSLSEWRESVRRRAERSVPPDLTQVERQRIRSEVEARITVLDGSFQSFRLENAMKMRANDQRHDAEADRVRAQLRDAEAVVAVRRRTLDKRVADLSSELAAAERLVATARNQANAYRQITVRAYARRRIVG